MGARERSGSSEDAVGTLTISPHFAQETTGSLSIDVGGEESGRFDRLVVSGTSVLGGTLVVRVLDGFLPGVADPEGTEDGGAESIGGEEPGFFARSAAVSGVLLSLDLPEPAAVRVGIFDLSGRLVMRGIEAGLGAGTAARASSGGQMPRCPYLHFTRRGTEASTLGFYNLATGRSSHARGVEPLAETG